MAPDDMPPRWYDDYERGRPGYPDRVVDLAGLPPSAVVLDLAAGTGKLTRLLAPRFASVVGAGPRVDMMSRGWSPAAWRLSIARETFEAIHDDRLANPQTADREGLLAFLGSMGWLASLPDADRTHLFAGLRARLRATDYVLPWETVVHVTRRRVREG